MHSAQRQIQLHRLFRRLGYIALSVLLLSSLLDHAGAFGYRGDDWRRFDRQTVHVDRIIDNQSFETGGTTVRLLGVRADQERTTTDVQSHLANQQVMLRLDVPQTRDAANELLAYVYLLPDDCWNTDLIQDGIGYADRQTPCSMLTTFIAAEKARDNAIGKTARKSHS